MLEIVVLILKIIGALIIIGIGLWAIVWIWAVLAGLGRGLEYLTNKLEENFSLFLTGVMIIVFFGSTGRIYLSPEYDDTALENLVFLSWFVFFIPIFVKIYMKFLPSLPESFSEQIDYIQSLQAKYLRRTYVSWTFVVFVFFLGVVWWLLPSEAYVLMLMTLSLLIIIIFNTLLTYFSQHHGLNLTPLGPEKHYFFLMRNLGVKFFVYVKVILTPKLNDNARLERKETIKKLIDLAVNKYESQQEINDKTSISDLAEDQKNEIDLEATVNLLTELLNKELALFINKQIISIDNQMSSEGIVSIIDNDLMGMTFIRIQVNSTEENLFKILVFSDSDKILEEKMVTGIVKATRLCKFYVRNKFT